MVPLPNKYRNRGAWLWASGLVTAPSCGVLFTERIPKLQPLPGWQGLPRPEPSGWAFGRGGGQFHHSPRRCATLAFAEPIGDAASIDSMPSDMRGPHVHTRH